MNIENIQCFISLAECLNFTRAAEREHITQTTMSHKISVLEKELGVKLLYRDTKTGFSYKCGNKILQSGKRDNKNVPSDGGRNTECSEGLTV